MAKVKLCPPFLGYRERLEPCGTRAGSDRLKSISKIDFFEEIIGQPNTNNFNNPYYY